MNKSKLFSIVLIFTMLTSCFTWAGADTTATVNSEDNIRTALFEYLGITVNTEASSINRGEFATQVAIAAGNFVNITESEISDFADVKATASNSKYIRAVCSSGIMNGVGDGNFAPNTPISTVNALVALVRLAGYEPMALAYGGYPGGYLRVALDKGISDGVSVGDENLSGDTLAKLLFNTLHTDVYQLASTGDTTSYIARKGEDVLYVYHNIYSVDAKVTANCFTSLFSTDTICTTDEIALDNERYKAIDATMADFLGMGVTAYYKKSATDKIGTVVAIAENKNECNTLSILSDDISSVDDYKVSYFEGDKERSIRIQRGFSFIYNGKLYEDGKISELQTVDANLTFIDGDGDKVFETVSMKKGETVIVANVERESYVIYGENQKTVRFDDSDPASLFIITDKDGNESYIDRIKTGNVVTAYSSKDNEYVKVVISTDTVKGTITELDSAEGTVKVLSGKETLEFKIATGYEASFVIGLSGEFYVDAFGKLVYSKNKPGSDYQYGYLFSGRFDGGMSSADLMILTSADFEVFKCADEVFIDGYKHGFMSGSANALYNGTKFIPQVLRFKTDSEGVIKFIDTENVGSGDTESDKLNPSVKVPVSGSYTPYFSSINSKCQVGADTLFVKVPGAEDTTNAFNESMLSDMDYYSNSKDSLGEGSSISNAYAYEMDDTLTPKMIVYYNNSLAAGGSGRIDNYSKMGIVLEHFRCLDKNGDARDALRIFTKAGKEEVVYFDSKYDSEVSHSMEFGDVIFYILDTKNCITKWSYDFDYSELSSDVKDGYWPRYVGYPYSKGDNAFSFLSAKSNANLVNDTNQTMADNSALSEDRQFLRVFPTKVMIYIEVDFDTRKAEKISYDNIDSFKHTHNTDKLAYVKTYRGGGNYNDIMIIYKNRPEEGNQ